MWLRLRQIAFVAEALAPVEQAIIDTLGVAVCYRDPEVAAFGLENVLFPIGNQFLEVVAPVRENTAGGRYLERRGGNGGYMIIAQCDDHAARKARVATLGIRTVLEHDDDSYRLMQLHPRDTGGTFFEIDQQLGDRAHEPDGPWHPAGPGWQRARDLRRVNGIVAATVQCDDPGRVARRWAEIAEIPLAPDLTLPLDNACIRFVECTDGRPEGLSEIDVAVTDAAAILDRARQRDAVLGDNQIGLCGVRINLVPAQRA